MRQQHTPADPSRENMTPEERRSAFSLAGTFFFRMLGLFMITPVFALYAEGLEGATPHLVGLAIGIYGLTQALFQIPFGMWSDRRGRKPIITIGLLIFTLGSAIAALSHQIVWVILGRALQGAGAVGSATMALAADLTREEQRIKAMAIIGITIGLAFPVAFIAGPAISAAWGTPAVFWVAGIFGLLAITVLHVFVPQPAETRFHRECEYSPAQFWEIAANPQLLRLDYGVFSLHLIMTATFVVTPLALRDAAGLDLAQHWKVYLPALALSMVALGPLFRLAEGRQRMKEVSCGTILLLASSQLCLYFFHGQLWGLGAALMLFFTAVNFLEASLPSLISRLAPVDRRGTAMGIYSTSQFLGIFLGGVAGGWLHGRFGLETVYLLNIAVAVPWLLFALTMPQLRRLSTRLVHIGAVTSAEASQLSARLLGIAGVVEAVVIAEDGAAYLKLDPMALDEHSLGEILPPKE
jgi:MFS family permease